MRAVISVDIETLARDPYPVLDELREREPVAWAPKLGRWLVTPRRTVLEVLLDPVTFTTASERSPIRRTFGPQMLSTDGDEQRRHRAPFAGPFRPRELREQVAASVAARAVRLVEGLDGPGADLAPLAATMAVTTVADVLGLEVDDPAAVRAWYEDFADALANVVADPDVAERGERTAELFRKHLAGRPVSPLMQAAVEALDERDLGSNALLLLFGGIETTESMILNAVWAILRHPEAREPSLYGNAVEESLRWEPAVQTLTRYATRDTEIGRVAIAAGDVVECMIGGANRDPAHFEDPGRFDPGRANARDHLTFGHGRHTCLGLHLARLETMAVIEALFESRPGVRLDGECAPFGHEFRKVRPLPVRWA